MSQSMISWRRIKTLNLATGERFVHASTRDANVWHLVRHDGTAAWATVIRIKHVGRVYLLEEDRRTDRWFSCSQLRERGQVPGFSSHESEEFLAEMDRRQAELDRENPTP